MTASVFHKSFQAHATCFAVGQLHWLMWNRMLTHICQCLHRLLSLEQSLVLYKSVSRVTCLQEEGHQTSCPWKQKSVATTTISPFCLFPDNPRMVSHVPVTIQVLDVNDNIPSIFGGNSAIIVCESTRYGQVRYYCSNPKIYQCFWFAMKACT